MGKWWKEVKNLAGISDDSGQWYCQLVDGDVVDSVATLCDRINDFFVNLTREFVSLTPDDVAGIAVESVPTELLTTPWEAEKALRGIKIKKAPGPDGLPNVVLKEFAYELGPVISDMYNASLRQGFLPPLLKSAVVRPLPKQKPAMSVEKDIRPVSLTCQVAKVMESFTLVRLLPVLLDKFDLKQFALSGRSTSQALVYLLHLALDALDKGNCALCFFFADFKKGFDVIDHRILLRKLSCYGLHPSLVRWLAAFLQGRSQCVQLADVSSASKSPNGGIPQGTKLSPILFAVMVDDLVRSWGPRIKYVDDLTILEVIPRNSPSVMKYLVNDVNSFAHCNNMQLNPSKCKLMRVDFLHYNSCYSQPIAVGGSVIESVESFKLLGVYISSDLSWSTHCDYIIKKSNRRLYALRKLKACGVQDGELVAVYCSLLRSVLEYASVVFANLPQYLCMALERVQKRALRIIFGPDLSYKDTLARAGLLSLEARRHLACKKFVTETMHASPLYRLISSRVISSQTSYSLRSGPSCHVLPGRTDRFSEFVSVKYSPYIDCV